MTTTLLGGLVGGLFATIVMTAVMLTLGDDSPPPTAILWSKYVAGGDPGDHAMPGMVLHLGYGVGAGGALVVGAGVLGLGMGTITGGLLWGVVWGILLFVVGAMFWMNIVLGLDADRSMMVQFGMLHVVYGIVLGVWVGLGLF